MPKGTRLYPKLYLSMHSPKLFAAGADDRGRELVKKAHLQNITISG
jgi:hypothetical protein